MLSSRDLFRYNKRVKFCPKAPGLELLDVPHSNHVPDAAQCRWKR